MGGYVALSFAFHYPQMLEGICLFHSTAEPDSEQKKLDRKKAINAVKQNRLEYIAKFIPNLFSSANIESMKPQIDRIVEHAKQNKIEGIVAAIEGMKQRPGYLEFLGKTSIPVLFIIGKNDPVIPFDKMFPQISLPYRSFVVALEQTGHMGFIEAEEESILAISSCLDGFFKN